MAAKQKELEGVGRKEIKEVEDAAEAYVTARDTRMAWTKKETETRKALIKLLHDNGLPAYEYEVEVDNPDGGKETIERVAELKTTEKLKVSKKGSDDGEEEDEPTE